MFFWFTDLNFVHVISSGSTFHALRAHSITCSQRVDLDIKGFICTLCLKRGLAVADLGENLTGALHSNFRRGGCGGRGLHGS